MRTDRLLVGTTANISRRGKVIAASAALLLVGVVALPGWASSAPSLTARLISATHVTKQASGSGYWVVSSDGVVFAFGGAHLYGSMVGHALTAPIVGIVATADGRGYWLVAKDGGVFSFGDATFAGSLGNRFRGEAIVGMASSGGAQAVASGVRGPRGLRGLVGRAGLIGVRGIAGPMGAEGPAGARGANGSNGSNGGTGSPGSNGINGTSAGIGGTGANGGTGLTGGTGVSGGTGLTGGSGAAGGTGPQGPSTSANYGLMYNVGGQSVAVNAAINFDSSGPMVGFNHGLPSPAIQAQVAGTYRVNFSVSGVEANQFAIFVNGVLVPNSTYGAGSGNAQNNGTAILNLNPNDDVTLVNHVSAAAVTLQTLAGGTQINVNASMLVTQLG